MSNMNVKYVMNVFTPQQCRDEIVKWLKDQAINHRTSARLAQKLKTKYAEEAKAETLEFAADYIGKIEIDNT